MEQTVQRADAKRLIADEGLEGAVWFERGTNKTNAVAIYEVDAGFRVVSTDERAAEIGPREYSDESEALTMYVTLLRDRKELVASGVIT
ncbi:MULTISPECIES: hypothetical protein [unclassified Curtobacterium]|uniref:hypothetical protein n=1 Tax=unclassified Curtobacterium TaxID=257496 RepID=UPI00380B3446